MSYETYNQNSIKGKLGSTSEKFRAYFLLLFTKELIKHSKEEFFELEHTIRKKERKLKREPTIPFIPAKIKPQNKEEEKYILSLMNRRPIPRSEKDLLGPTPQKFNIAPIVKRQLEIPSQEPKPQHMPPRKRPYRPLFIPEAPLPQDLQYIQPYPTNIPVNLGKLEPLALDPNVRTIECNGPDEPIIVKGNMGTRPTAIILNSTDINNILQSFSEASKIPLNEGIFKIAAGRYLLSAIISDVVGSKFIIRKMVPQMYPPMFGRNY